MTPPSGPELENFRRYHVRVFRMGRIVIKSICYLTFAWALFVVCYGNRDKTQFLMTKGLQNVFDNKVGAPPLPVMIDIPTQSTLFREYYLHFTSSLATILGFVLAHAFFCFLQITIAVILSRHFQAASQSLTACRTVGFDAPASSPCIAAVRFVLQ